MVTEGEGVGEVTPADQPVIRSLSGSADGPFAVITAGTQGTGADTG